MLHFLLHTFFGGFLCGLIPLIAALVLLCWAIGTAIYEAIGRGLHL